MKGGSRCGAGRPAWHAKTGSCLRLDVRRLARDNSLSDGTTVNLSWPGGSSASYQVKADTIVLAYRYTFSDGARDISERIVLERTPCHYGGERVWFHCPRCTKRVAIIYLRGWPRCRTCARLVYPSQSDDAIARSWRRTGKIEKRLAGDAEKWNYRRPKGMRLATFDRLRAAYWGEDEIRDLALMDFIQAHGW